MLDREVHIYYCEYLIINNFNLELKKGTNTHTHTDCILAKQPRELMGLWLNNQPCSILSSG